MVRCCFTSSPNFLVYGSYTFLLVPFSYSDALQPLAFPGLSGGSASRLHSRGVRTENSTYCTAWDAADTRQEGTCKVSTTAFIPCCYGPNVCETSKFKHGTLIPIVTAVKDRVSRRGLGCEGGALMDGISDLVKRVEAQALRHSCLSL